MRKPLFAALAALLMLPAAASADQITFGSSLQGRADVMDNTHLADYLSFNTSSHNSHAAPASGEILAVRIKGAIVPKGSGKQDNNLFHTQVLRPNADGSFAVDSSSQHLYFPVGGSPDEVHTFVPSVQCIKKGEYLDFNHIGGWDGDMFDGRGTQYQIWKNDPSSSMFWYEHDQGTNIGATFQPNRQIIASTGQPNTANPQHGRPYARELMMQVVVGTGFDASQSCEGGLKGFEYEGVTVVSDRTFTVYDDGIGGVRLACLSGRGFCQGTVRLSVDGTEIGSAPFQIGRSLTTNVDVPLTGEGARIVNTRGQVTADVTVDSRDEIGQQRTTRGTTGLKSARPTPNGFAGAVLKAQSSPVKNNQFGVTATCPLGTEGNCTGTMTIFTQKRVPLRAGSRGKVYTMGKAQFSIEPGKRARIPVKLTSGGKKVMRRLRSVVSIANVTTQDAAGRSVSKRSKVVLKRR